MNITVQKDEEKKHLHDNIYTIILRGNLAPGQASWSFIPPSAVNTIPDTSLRAT